MKTNKGWDEIQAKIAAGEAAVLTAGEFKLLAREADAEELCRRVDAVTVATFAPMCSSGVFINFGHGSPPIRMEELSLDGVPAYGGVAAVDAYLGATAERPGDPGFGGAHVIETLVRGGEVRLEARGKGTDCYPGRSVSARVRLADLNEAWFDNPRNAYQNYGAGTNGSDRALRTYLGVLEPRYGTVSYATSGELSPLLNDPQARFIGAGTAAWVGGAVGMVTGCGTQFDTEVPVNGKGLPVRGSRTLALRADLKAADPRFVAAAAVPGYGVSLFLGVAFCLPVTDAEAARALSVRDEDITVQVRDYGAAGRPVVLETSYAELRSGSVEIAGVRSRSACSSSLAKARELARELRDLVRAGRFPVRPPVEALPARASPRPLAAATSLSAPASAASPPEGVVDPSRTGPAGYARRLCVDCGACVSHCPARALSLEGEGPHLAYDASACAGCGTCAGVCPRGAFRSEPEARHG